MFNKLIGERMIKLSGVDYVLTPDFRAFQAIEERTGKSILHLVDIFHAGYPMLKQICSVLYECYVSNRENSGQQHYYTYNEFGKLVLENGPQNYLTECLLLTAHVLSGGDKKKVTNDSEAPSETPPM